MARHVQQEEIDAQVAELTAQQEMRQCIASRYGWRVESVRFPNRASASRRFLCFAKVRVGLSRGVEYIFVKGLLLGIPVRTPWEE